MSRIGKIQGKSLNNIGVKIEKLISELGLKLTPFLAEIKISRTAYDRMLDKKRCNVTTLERLSDYFKKPITYWYDDEVLKVYGGDEMLAAMAAEDAAEYRANSETIDALLDKINSVKRENNLLESIVEQQKETIELLKSQKIK